MYWKDCKTPKHQKGTYKNALEFYSHILINILKTYCRILYRMYKSATQAKHHSGNADGFIKIRGAKDGFKIIMKL